MSSGAAAAARPSARRRRTTALALLAVIAAAYLALPWLSSRDTLRLAAERNAAAASGFDVAIADLHVGYDFNLHLGGVAVAARDGADFFTAERIDIRVAPAGLFSGQPFDLRLTAPRLHLDRLPRGDTAASAATSPALPVRSLEIEDGYAVLGADTDPIGPISVSIDARHAAGQDARLSVLLDPDLPPIDARGTVDAVGGALTVAMRLDWPAVPLALVAQRFSIDTGGALSGILDATAEIAGPLTQWRGSGSLQIGNLEWTAGDLRAGAADTAADFTFDSEQVAIGERGLRFTDIAWSGAGVSGSANAATITAAANRDGKGLRLSGALDAGPLSGSDAASERVVDGVAARGKFDLRWSGERPPTLRAEFAVDRGEVLWQRFYADIGKHPASAAATVSRDGRGRIAIADLRLRAAGLGAVYGTVQLAKDAQPESAQLRVEVADLADLYTLAIAEPLQESVPFLAAATAAGNLEIQATYRRNRDAFSLRGRLRLRDGALVGSNSGFALRGVRLDLPFQLGSGEDHRRQSGAMGFGDLNWGGLQLRDVSAEIFADDDRLGLAAPLSVSMFGGLLRVREFSLDDLRAERRRAALALTVAGLDLAQLTAAAGLPPLRGNVSGEIPKITAVGDDLRSEGEIRVEVFDGSIAVRNLSVDRAFSSLPALGLDVEFEEISLGRLTDTLSVGRIEGVARGAAHNLVIVDRQPVSFEAWMATVERPGVAQRISVSAIRQLSILGGSGGDPITQGVLGFFDEYRYAKMGFRCRLENDRFELRGVERIDGKEHLVVGSRVPPRVNVVSHTQIISFPDMVRRLQRIAASGTGDEERGTGQ